MTGRARPAPHNELIGRSREHLHERLLYWRCRRDGIPPRNFRNAIPISGLRSPG
jgi:hypothetical protein